MLLCPTQSGVETLIRPYLVEPGNTLARIIVGMSAPPSPEGPSHQLSIHVDFNTLRAKLARAVDRMIRLVSIGYEATEHPVKEELRMPGSGWLVTFSDTPAWTEDEARQHYQSWLFATGLRNVLEAFGSFLDECHEITAYIALLRKFRKRETLVGQDLFDQQEAVAKFRRLGIDKKLDKLKPWFAKILPEAQEGVRSINRARNIFTHHDGIVPASYCDENGGFQISWFRLQLVTMGGKNEREVEIGSLVGPGEGVGIRATRESRSFRAGEPLRIQPKDFSGICWTVFTGGDSLREQIENDYMSATADPLASETGENATGA